jgi:hypothetical protein
MDRLSTISPTTTRLPANWITVNTVDDPLKIAREFAGTLSLPVFLVDPGGDLLYYNHEAERVLGMSFGVTGAMPANVWSRIFIPTDESGNPPMPDALPLMKAVQEEVPSTDPPWIRGIEHKRKHFMSLHFPLSGRMAPGWEPWRCSGRSTPDLKKANWLTRAGDMMVNRT